MAGGGEACVSMKLSSFLGSPEDTGNEVGRKRHYGKGRKRFVQLLHLHPRVYLVYNFGVEIEM